MEFLCENCFCKPICYLYSVTGGIGICKYFIAKDAVRAEEEKENV